MARSGAHVGEAEHPQQCPDIALVIGHPETLLDDALQIDPPPAHHPVLGRVQSSLDDPGQLSLFVPQIAAVEGSGPKKPELVRVFGPLGYDCKGGHGTFTLRRRTATNLTVELEIDVGTWSNSCSASLSVDTLSSGVAMSALLRLPVTKRAIEAPQYPIGDAERWQKIVENLGALVAELDRTFVPAVEAIAGPAPEWYQPESKTA